MFHLEKRPEAVLDIFHNYLFTFFMMNASTNWLEVCLFTLIPMMVLSNLWTDLKKGHHQVSHTQIDHEHVHRCIILPPPQQHPQHKAIPQGGESQHQTEHCNLCPGQTQVPHPGLGQGVRRGGGTILREDAEEGPPAVRTIEGVQFRDKQRRGREVVPSCGDQRGEA